MKRFFYLSVYLCALIGLVASDTPGIAKTSSKPAKALLTIEAANDRPGPVEIWVEGCDVKGRPTVHTVLAWDGDNDTFSRSSLSIKKTTRTLRFTFMNANAPSESETPNRTMLIDYFTVNNLYYEAQNWQHAGAAVPESQGCRNATVRGRSVVLCENTGDWVEYRLHPGNPVRSKSKLTIGVDDTLKPSMPETFRLDPDFPRPLARVTDEFGNESDFVENELWVSTEDQGVLDGILNRWQGEVVSFFDPGEFGIENLPPQYLVRINTTLANVRRLARHLRRLNPESSGKLRVSSSAGLGLLSAGAAEAIQGVQVGINWVGEPSSMFRDGVSLEAPHGTRVGGTIYDPNAFTWPSHSLDSEQGIGVAEAWKLLETAGKLNNTVRIANLDLGFQRPDQDYRNGWIALRMPSAPALGTPSPIQHPWHGTLSLSAMAAQPNNGYGSAGTAGPVAYPILISISPTNFSKAAALGKAKRHGAQIVNMNYYSIVPHTFDWSLHPFDQVTAGVRAAGILLFAPAGNDGRNVDAGNSGAGQTFEKAWFTPCENNGVICVGGLQWDSNRWHHSSNFGGQDVDIYAPFTLWLGPTPDSFSTQIATHVNGTSFSSPFAAGVAALIWAADPTLTADEVEHILFHTAHTTPYAIVNRYVNAHDAVEEALSHHNNPPFVEILMPRSNDIISGLTRFHADAHDLEDGDPSVSWTSSLTGPIGEGEVIMKDLDAGTHTITATATDSEGYTSSDTITVEVIDEPLAVRIISVAPGTTIYQSQALFLMGESSDGGSGLLPESQVAWYLDGDTTSFATGHTATIAGGELDLGDHTITFVGKEGSVTASTSISIQVQLDPTQNIPPTVFLNRPQNGDQFPANYVDSQNGKRYAEVTLCGHGEDPEDGYLVADWFQKTDAGGFSPVVVYGYATSDTSGLCPIIHLYLEGGSRTTYLIRCEVSDIDGATAQQEIDVEVFTIQ
jgi:serine protease